MARLGPARRYAEAIFDLATTAGKVDEWRAEIGLVCDLTKDRNLARVMDSPAVAFAQRRVALERLLAARVSREVLNLTLLLTTRCRFTIMSAVSDEYDALVRHSRGIVGVTVTSAAPLSPEELAAVKIRLEQLAAARVEINTEVDPSLIGGLRVKIGDRQIDASVATRLARLRRQLVGAQS